MGPRREIDARIRGAIAAKPGIQTGPAQILSHACQKATLAWKLGNNIDARK